MTGSQFAELEQTKDQLHQNAVSGVSCSKTKIIFNVQRQRLAYIFFNAEAVLKCHTVAIFEKPSDLFFVAMQLSGQLL